MKTHLLAMLSAAAVSAFAGNEANPDAVELAPLPMPVEFKSDMDSPVAFDASTTVALDCPDAKGAEWLAAHFGEWYGKDAPKVVAANLSTFSAFQPFNLPGGVCCQGGRIGRQDLGARAMIWHDMLLDRGGCRHQQGRALSYRVNSTI